jgi:uncharacterized protein (TIGR02996 family)
MSEEAAFLASIRDHPQDDLRRLVYADWLEERGTDESRVKAEYLRLEVHVASLPGDHSERDNFVLKLRELAEPLSEEWKITVAKVRIENCEIRGRFQCPKTWDQVQETENYSMEVRCCSTCYKYVVYCSSVGIARYWAESEGHRVVIDRGVRRDDHDMDSLGEHRDHYGIGYPGPTELDISFGIDPVPSLFQSPPSPPPSEQPRPGFLRRLWRKLTKW